MDVPVIVDNRLRFRVRWRLFRLMRSEDGCELRIWGHPALQLAMTPAGFDFKQIDWYTFTFSYKRRRVIRVGRNTIEPARLLAGVASGAFGFLYFGVYVSDWPHMLRSGELPLEIGRLRLGRQH